VKTGIEFRDVSVASAQGRARLSNVSLALEAGTTTAVLGRSGSGKTTLLRTVNHMVEPTSGSVLVHGTAVRDADTTELRRNIGYVIQETGLFPHFTVERNVGIVLEVQGRNRGERVHRSHELLASVGLSPETFAKRFPHELSGGQRQRVGLARALAAEPGILLLDEPFGALDPLTRSEMQELLRGLLAQVKRTVLLVTHDLNEALYLGDRIVLLGEGRVVATLTPDEFRSSSDHEVEAYRRAFDHENRNSAPARHE
jgi:osmoprotectant transport system ATP-binding protein